MRRWEGLIWRGISASAHQGEGGGEVPISRSRIKALWKRLQKQCSSTQACLEQTRCVALHLASTQLLIQVTMPQRDTDRHRNVMNKWRR